MSTVTRQTDTIDREIAELVDTVYSVYGYDFRDYAHDSQRRRVLAFVDHAGLASLGDARRRVAEDKVLFYTLLEHLTVPTTELFRDPHFYRAFVTHVVPVLKTYASVNVWHAGCSSGEEAYSMAILLHEHGLLERATIYATDVDRVAVTRARKGIVSVQTLKRGAGNYFAAGLSRSLSDYWHSRHGYALLDARLLERLVFSEHNLATDASFGEMNVALCRNVLIYFNKVLQDRALGLLMESLGGGGILCLGTKESISFSSVARELETVCRATRIFRKKVRL